MTQYVSGKQIGSVRDFDGKVAVVTGSASGIGRAIALELADAGAHVLVHAGKSKDAAEAVAAAICSRGCRSHAVLADLSDEAACRQFAEMAWNWLDGVDIWVNNAGADVLTTEASDWSFGQRLERLWQVDVRACLLLSRAIGQRMQAAESKNRTIINVGWDQAEHGMAGESGEMFSAIKGAVMAFSRSLAQSLAPDVRVNCVAPGWIRTSWGQNTSQYWNQRAKAESLRGRWGEVEDVAKVVRFLASNDADFINGQVIPVNGGWRRSEPKTSE
jgi:3-oxoacyl-[acyl-carrier protein] reductase